MAIRSYHHDCVVIEYQNHIFTHTWLVVSCVMLLDHTFTPRLTGIVSALVYFPLELGSKDYNLWDQAVNDILIDQVSILMDSPVNTTLVTFFDESDAISLSVCSWFLCLVSTFLIILNHSFLLAPYFIQNVEPP